MHAHSEVDERAPLMTLRAAGHWLAVPIAQLERVVSVQQHTPVPLAPAWHLGIADDGEQLWPLASLRSDRDAAPSREHLVAVLHVRGEAVALSIEQAGRVVQRYRLLDSTDEPPAQLRHAAPRLVHTEPHDAWLVNPDLLWPAAAGRPALPDSRPELRERNVTKAAI